MAKATEPVRCSIGVGVPPERAFEIFVGRLGRWWPIPYTYSEDQFETAAIEPRDGGHWFETRLDGSREDWGEVRRFEPGKRLVLSFNVGADRKPEPPERHSKVEITFVPASGGSRVEVEYRDFAKHGEGAETLREGLERQGWPVILASYAREVRQSH